MIYCAYLYDVDVDEKTLSSVLEASVVSAEVDVTTEWK